MEQKYYVGLDIGTNSVGWAVTDENYHLLRAKGKDLWGVRLFEKANTSEERRSHRTARRRLNREKLRNTYVKEMFSAAINNIDPGFFQRLQDSKFTADDKTEKQRFTLFCGEGFTDKEYYELFPTVFHLRSELIHNPAPHDVRLVYLAVLNIFKHRGHFLNANLGSNNSGEFSESLESLRDMMQEYLSTELDCTNAQKIEDTLSSKDYSNSRKAEIVAELFSINKRSDKGLMETVKLLCGLKGKIAVIFPEICDDDEHAKLTFSFRDSNFEEKYQEAEDILSEDAIEILATIKQIHDYALLSNIMKEGGKTWDYLSDARISSYNKHKGDLKILKDIIHKYGTSEDFNQMFRVMEDNNYSAYVGSVNSNKTSIKTIRRGAKCTTADFYNKVKKLISGMDDCEEKEYILKEIDKETFLPKQITPSNGVIPYQLHKKELVQILQNASAYLPFLSEVDESGLTVKDRIIAMFEFRIPYYVGPLYNNGEGNAWSVRKEEGRVYPWNINQKIDMEESAALFINRMVKRCSYLNDAQVLPKNSLLYEKFMVLNELNNLKINGVPVSVEWKQELYKELFRKGRKVTQKAIIKWLQAHGSIGKNETVDISGIDKDFTNTLANYAKFAAIFDTEVLSWEQEKIAEKIIFWATVYGDSRDFVKRKIKQELSSVLTENQLKKVLKLKLKDWGRLSKQFLELEGADKQTGEIKTIISRMWDDNYNLMELLSNGFTYVDELEERTARLEENLSEISYTDLEGQYLNAPVKRMVWQTILIMKELTKVLGSEPAKIFVEMARDHELDPKRTISRKKKLEASYKGIKEDKSLLKDLSARDEKELKWKKLYLYYQQRGRCMYTGQIINIEDLSNDNLYDIDHIYPRHFVKDDSLENNLVLVKKEKNAHKSDSYPIEGDIRSSMFYFWKGLYESKLITHEKFNRLIRDTEFTVDEQVGFINRQLVETRQGTKAVAGIFSSVFGKGKVIYVKAGNVSAFRKKFDLIKCREINDLHHAHDAFLNIVVGNTYDIKFTRNVRNFVEKSRGKTKGYEYHMDKIFDYTVKNKDTVAWNVTNNESIKTVKYVVGKNTPLVTVMTEEVHGGISDQQIVNAKAIKKVNGEGYLPVKTTDSRLQNTSKYGGYSKLTGTYFFLVEHTQKKKRVRTLEAVPLYLEKNLRTKTQLEKYCKEEKGYIDPSVRLTKIKAKSLFKIEGYYQYVTGRSGNQLVVNNAVQLLLSYDDQLYVRNLQKSLNEQTFEDAMADTFRVKNIDLYKVLLSKFTKGIYRYRRPLGLGKQLEKGLASFEQLSIMDQFYILNQIIMLVQMKSRGADLRRLGESKQCGVSMLTKKLSDYKDAELINLSITGLYESRINLLTV